MKEFPLKNGGIGTGEAAGLRFAGTGGLNEKAIRTGLEHGHCIGDQGFSRVKNGGYPGIVMSGLFEVGQPVLSVLTDGIAGRFKQVSPAADDGEKPLEVFVRDIACKIVQPLIHVFQSRKCCHEIFEVFFRCDAGIGHGVILAPEVQKEEGRALGFECFSGLFKGIGLTEIEPSGLWGDLMAHEIMLERRVVYEADERLQGLKALSRDPYQGIDILLPRLGNDVGRQLWRWRFLGPVDVDEVIS